MSPMPDFPDISVETKETSLIEDEKQNLANIRKVSITVFDPDGCTIFDNNKETKLSDININDDQRTEKNALTRDASVDTLASK